MHRHLGSTPQGSRTSVRTVGQLRAEEAFAQARRHLEEVHAELAELLERHRRPEHSCERRTIATMPAADRRRADALAEQLGPSWGWPT